MKKFFFLVSFLIIFGFLFNFGLPIAKAMTASEIQALINQLLSQIADLQKQLAQSQEQPVAWCHDFNTNLRIGDTGEEAWHLRMALARESLDFRIPAAEEQYKYKSEFDEDTASAVVGFQEKYKDEVLSQWGLKRGTGYVGKSTRTKLNKLYGCEAITPPVVTPPATTTPIISPSITVLSPNYGYIGDTINLVITGKNLTGAGAYSSWCGLDTTAFQGLEAKGCGVISDSQMYAKFVISNLAILGTRYISVRTGSGGASNSVAFEVRRSGTAPSITVLSPNGGEKWIEGNTYDIVWRSQGIDKVFINVVDYNTQDTCRLTYDVENYVSAEKGKYSWAIGSGKCSVSPGDKFKIEIQEPEGTHSPRIKDQSDGYFSIVSSAPVAGDINVFYPTYGQTFTAKQMVNIKWNSSNVSKVKIDLCGVSNTLGEICNWLAGIPDSGIDAALGQFQWYVDPNDPFIPGDNLQIKVSDAGNALIWSKTGYFSLISETVYSDTAAPEMEYPQDGQTLNYGSPYGYIFKVKPIKGASGYRFMFYQGGVLIYDNLRDQGQLSSVGEFAFWPGDKGYSSFQKGDVRVEIRALLNNNWTNPRIITIKLSNPDLQPTGITFPFTFVAFSAGDNVAFDSGVRNNGGVDTDGFNVKWFVDDVQVGYGYHSGVPGNSTVMDGNSQFNWTAAEGTHTIKFVVDTDNYVAESDETNNSVKTTITIGAKVALPQITIISPNGGEKLKIKDTYSLQWCGNNFSANTLGGYAYLKLAGPGFYRELWSSLVSGITGCPSSDIYIWQIGQLADGSQVSEGSYMILVQFWTQKNGMGNLIAEGKTEYFSIVSAQATSTPVQ